ncbi:conserved unknown protein [Ectocarpus siliculosus]|uniref:Uncharacterized protein n=1 Tax=Ectocarpus siliculosus TaxID=2880 RepID=D8LAV9_ECTSI|nr:conserved unknown protein [Ectocarpus siliculosus]|eukprot:CBN76468.1 conserved unknown protein [Ectocarpus siliculosus]
MFLRDPWDKEFRLFPVPPEQPPQAGLSTTDATADAAPTTAGASAAGSITSELTSPHGNVLVDVGFWADPRDSGDKRPDPAQLVDEEWGGTVEAVAVALYVRSGFLESFELGYSFCRFGCCGDGSAAQTSARDSKRRSWFSAIGGNGGRCGGGAPEQRRGPKGSKFMGCTTLTDGKYVWPEGLAHYIEEHAVRPPDDFVTFSLRNLRALREAQAGGRLHWEVDERGRGRMARLSPGTAVFLKDNTTLGIALPPEPEVRKTPSGGSREEEQRCSCMLPR